MAEQSVTYQRISVKAIEQDVAAAFRPVVNRMTGLIAAASDTTGHITLRPEARQVLIDRVGAEVNGLFVGPDKKNAFASDGVTAIAPFPQVLNVWYVRTVARSVKVYHDQMKAALPEHLYRWLRRARAPRLEMAGNAAIIEQLKILRPDYPGEALKQFERMHSWVDPKGTKLSQRIWRSGIETSDRMERLLEDLINQGVGSLEISRQMEQFLLPGLEALRTNKPYGTDASYYAMRLARSEIAYAANRSAYLSALLNPFVETIDIARSPYGDVTCKICPQYATIDISQNRVREPYPVGQANVPIFHSHCMCRVQSNVGKAPDSVIAQLQAWFDQGGEPPITPSDDELVLWLLLGPILLALLRRLGQGDDA